jgi:Domain of unknown function (DUF892)
MQHQRNIMLGLDLMLLRAALISHEPDDAGIAVGARFQRTRPQAARELRGQHADADLFDDVPDAIQARLRTVFGLRAHGTSVTAPQGGGSVWRLAPPCHLRSGDPAQAVEHYEISRYGTLIAWAEELGLDDAVTLLEETTRRGKGDRPGSYRDRQDSH